MIIRPAVKSGFTVVPNSIVNDRTLSADTRAMVVFMLSKPQSWEVRPGPLARALSREGGKPLGRTRLSRMFDEATAAGYMARSAEQAHQDDGRFGKYVYFVGMPDDVRIAVERSSVAFLPHVRKPHAGEPHTGEPCAANEHTSHKERNLKNKDFRKPPPTAPVEQADALHGCPKEGNAADGSCCISLSQSDDTLFEDAAIKEASRIANRLGPDGWAVLQGMTASELDQLTARERAGTLRDEALALVHARFLARPARSDAG
jgi:hypothetical protein